jgi:hypothetical protein
MKSICVLLNVLPCISCGFFLPRNEDAIDREQPYRRPRQTYSMFNEPDLLYPTKRKT